MDGKEVKALLGKTGDYDTKQITFDGCSAEAAQPRRELALSAGKKAICSRFFRVRIGCNVTLLKLS